MWPRLCEIAVGLWLMAAPWVLPHAPVPPIQFYSETIGGGLCALLAAATFLPKLRHANYAEIPVGLWIAGVDYFTSTAPAPPTVQSALLAIFFLLNFAIIPTHASTPPKGWLAAVNDPA